MNTSRLKLSAFVVVASCLVLSACSPKGPLQALGLYSKDSGSNDQKEFSEKNIISLLDSCQFNCENMIVLDVPSEVVSGQILPIQFPMPLAQLPLVTFFIPSSEINLQGEVSPTQLTIEQLESFTTDIDALDSNAVLTYPTPEPINLTMFFAGLTAGGALFHSQLISLSVIVDNNPNPVEGWTEFVPTAATKIIYVSKSDPNGCQVYNSQQVSNPFQPTGNLQTCRTFPEALAASNGSGNTWILFKKGDQWTGQISGDLEGQNENTKLLVGSYGPTNGDRPVISAPATVDQAVNIGGGDRHVAVVGLELVKGAQVNNSTDILIEDCLLYGGTHGVKTSNSNNLVVRRNVLVDSTKQGVKAQGTSGLLVEQNVFDANGGSSFDHNMYIGINTSGSRILDNLVTRGGNRGIKFRTNDDGEIRGNIIFDNNDGVSIHTRVSENEGLAENIVFAENILSEGHTNAMSVRPNMDEVLIEKNIFAPGSGSIAFHHKNGPIDLLKNLTFRKNTIFRSEEEKFVEIDDSPGGPLLGGDNRFEDNILQGVPKVAGGKAPLFDLAAFMGGHLSFSGNWYFSEDPEGRPPFNIGNQELEFNEWVATVGETGAVEQKVQFVDPSRNVGSYHGTLGKEPTPLAFILEARKQQKGKWREEYAIDAVREYIREGFRPLTPGAPGAVD